MVMADTRDNGNGIRSTPNTTWAAAANASQAIALVVCEAYRRELI